MAPLDSTAGRYAWLLLALALGVTVLCYGPGLGGGFVFDDYPNIVRNGSLTGAKPAFRSLLEAALSSDAGPLARPLSMLSFALQVPVAGLSPRVFKGVNLAIHLINGLLVFLLCRQVVSLLPRGERVGPPGTAAAVLPAAVAAAWLLAPINLTSVLYIVQRMESLSGFFTLLGLVAYLRGRSQLEAGRPTGWGWILGGMLGGTALAALAKETGLLLPAYAFLLEWMLFRMRVARAPGVDRRMLFLFGSVLVLPGLLGVAWTLPSALSGAVYAGRNFTLAERLWTEGRVLVDYLHWIVAPGLGELGLYHDDYPVSKGWLAPVGTLPSLLALAGLLLAAVKLRVRLPLAALGILFFFVGHSLVSTYLPLELVYEHRNYLPSIGVFLALFSVLLIDSGPGGRRAAAATVVLVLIGLSGYTTYQRAVEWSDPVRLAYAEAGRHPASPRANYELGRALAERATTAEGAAFRLAIDYFERAGRLPGTGLFPIQGIILTRANHGLSALDEHWRALEDAIRNAPLASQDVSALQALTAACSGSAPCPFEPGRLGDVLALAVALNPGHADLLTLHASYAVNIARDSKLGFRLIQETVALAPGKAENWKNLITVQIQAGQLAEARVGIDYLRELNRFGMLTPMIDRLEVSLRARLATTSGLSSNQGQP